MRCWVLPRTGMGDDESTWWTIWTCQRRVTNRVKSRARKQQEIPTSSDDAPARVVKRVRGRRIRRQTTRRAEQLTASTSTPAFVIESGAAVCYEQRANTVPAMERNRAAFRCGGAREEERGPRGRTSCKVFLFHKVKPEDPRGASLGLFMSVFC